MFNATMFPPGCVGIALYQDSNDIAVLLQFQVWSANRSGVMFQIDGKTLQPAFSNLTATALKQALSASIENNTVHMLLIP